MYLLLANISVYGIFFLPIIKPKNKQTNFFFPNLKKILRHLWLIQFGYIVPWKWFTNKIIQVSIILFSKALNCTPLCAFLSFSQFVFTIQCHLSVFVIYVLNYTQIIVIIVYSIVLSVFVLLSIFRYSD